ncbi:MAG: O-succinylhomoserine sulfhydrylase [Alphaproteobacteria bacterium]
MAKDTAPPAAPNWRPATKLVRGGLKRSQFQETSEAIFATSGYVYENAEDAESAFKGEKQRYIYSRFSNPTVAMFEERMALLEGAEVCRATASGMSAVFAALAATVRAGDRVVGPRALFGSCLYILTDILPRYGVETVIVDGTDLDQWEKALAKPTKAIFLETPSNPTLEVVDLAKVSEMAHAAGALVIVDNVFASPILQKPLTLGADVVVYSATKHIDGQGRVLGGAILGSHGDYMDEQLRMFVRHTGPSLSPFNAWTLLKGLETLELRIERHCKNATVAAEFLETQKRVARTLYPGLKSHPQHALAMKQMSGPGSIIAFEVAGGKAAAFRFLNALKMIDVSNNLGDAKSLISHPATTTHQRLPEADRAKLGISDGLVRLSVGLEDAQDIVEDLAQALDVAGR